MSDSNEGSIDFNTIGLTEDLNMTQSHTLSENAKQKAYEINKEVRIWAQQNNISVSGRITFHKPSATQLDYDARLYCLLAMVREPERTNQHNPLSTVFKELYPHLKYNSRLVDRDISTRHKERLLDAMQGAGIKPVRKPKSPSDYIQAIRNHYLLNRAKELEAENAKLRQLMYDSGNIWYRGVEIRRLSRKFKCEVNGHVLETGHATFDKLNEFLGDIDDLLDAESTNEDTD